METKPLQVIMDIEIPPYRIEVFERLSTPLDALVEPTWRAVGYIDGVHEGIADVTQLEVTRFVQLADEHPDGLVQTDGLA